MSGFVASKSENKQLEEDTQLEEKSIEIYPIRIDTWVDEWIDEWMNGTEKTEKI